MSWLGALLAVSLCLCLLRWLRVPAQATQVAAQLRTALAELRDPALEEREKERRVRAHALTSLQQFAVIAAATAVAVGVPALLLWLGDRTGVLRLEPVLVTMAGWPFLLITTLGIALLLCLRRQPRP